MKRNRELLERTFPKAYIEQGLNATRAYMQIKKNATYHTARVEGSRLLAKPAVQKKLQEFFPDVEADIAVLREALNAKPSGEIGWGDLHRFLETSLRVKGYLPKRNTASTSLYINRK